jgi:hypothetical protein
MIKNNFLFDQIYFIRLENELLIEKIMKLEKEIGLKEKEIRDLKREIQQNVVNS